VVTYVASAVDYKEKYDGLYSGFQAAKQSENNANKQFNELKSKTDEEKLALGEKVGALQQEIGSLEAKLKQAEIARDDAQRKADGWEAVVKDFSKTIETNDQLRNSAIAEQQKTTAELIKERAEHEQTSTALLEDKSKRLLEEKTELQNKLDGILREYGKVVAPAVAVTAMKEDARVAPPTQNIDLKGLITVVDMKNLLAEISIGEADGVKEGMRFHATRSDKFVCDVVILDVEPEKAVGWLELLADAPEHQPRVNDQVNTNL
jgi:uncharacterized phage infection (PIP) family protein YhgE